MKNTRTLSMLAGALLALLAGSAAAQSAGTWSAKIGINQISPQVSSGDLSAPSLAGTQIDVKAASSVIVTGTYMLTDHASVEFYGGAPYKHDIEGAGAIAGVGKLGTIKQVSPTLFAQYRFMDSQAPFRPYLGLGLTYAYFYGAEGSGTLTALTNPGGSPTTMKVDSAFGLSPQVGATLRLNPHWYLDVSLIKTFLKTTTTLSTGQSIDAKLDPISFGLSLGYRY